MTKVIQICVEGNTGSTGRIAEEIGILAIQRGWKSYIAFGRFPRPSKSNLIPISSKWGVYLHVLETRLFDRHGLGSKVATKKLIKQIIEIKPDIIHLHHLHGYYINIEILFDFLANADIPVVWTFHDCWSFTGHCAYFDFVDCNKWQLECNSCPQKNEYPASWMIDRSKKNFYQKKALFTSVKDMVIVPVSKWLSELVDKSFLSNIPRKVIYNGIDINLFSINRNNIAVREKYNVGNRFLILGVASPWSRRKGLEDFIKLSKLLAHDMVIILVGLDKKQIKNLPSNVIGLSRTENQNELKDLYSTADVFVNPTWEDNFPTTNLESLACGTPVITYKTGGSVEAISSDTGFVINKGDINSIVNSINIVKRNGKEYYKDLCRNRAIDLYNKEDRFKEYLDLYEELIKKSGNTQNKIIKKSYA